MILDLKEGDTLCVHAGATVTYVSEDGDTFVGKLQEDQLLQVLENFKLKAENLDNEVIDIKVRNL